MSAHTPGPWTVEQVRDRAGLVYARINSDSVHRSTGSRNTLGFAGVYADDRRKLPSDEVLANANLIAAAPDLLAVAENSLEDLEGFSGDDDYWARVATLRAAIKKARGDK